MGETKEKKIAWWRSDLARGVCVFIGVIFLALIFEGISKVILPLLGNPGFLMISDKIIVTDLLVGVFTAQVTMITIAISFTGLIMQLFAADKKHLGINLREAILEKKVYGLKLLSFMTISLLMSLASYFFVTQYMVAATLSLFVVSSFIVYILLKYYVLYLSVEKTMLKTIQNDFCEELFSFLEEENTALKDNETIPSAKQSEIFMHVFALQEELERLLRENKLSDSKEFLVFFFDLINQSANTSVYPQKSHLVQCLVTTINTVASSLLRQEKYSLSLSFFTSSISNLYNRNKENELDQKQVDMIGNMYITIFRGNIIQTSTEIISKETYNQNYYGVIRLIMQSQLYILENEKSYQLSETISIIFRTILFKEIEKQTQNINALRTYIRHYRKYIIESLISLNKKVSDRSKVKLLELYAFELTTMLGDLYLCDKTELMQEILDLNISNVIGIENVKEKLVPVLAINLMAMFVANEYQYKQKSLSVWIASVRDGRESIAEFSQRFLHDISICEISFRSLSRLDPLSYERDSPWYRNENFPEIVLLLVCLFYMSPKYYSRAMQWVRDSFILSWVRKKCYYIPIKLALEAHPDMHNASSYSKILRGFIDFYSLEEYLNIEKEVIIQKLYMIDKALNELYNKRW